jgi:hypothetical protein
MFENYEQRGREFKRLVKGTTTVKREATSKRKQ